MEKGGAKVLIVILVILMAIAGGVAAYKILGEKEETNTEEFAVEEKEEPVVEEKTVQTFSGNDRPIAVMIDNHKDAWPQVGLQNAYMIYEILKQ